MLHESGQRGLLERFLDELLLGIEPRGKDATGVLSVGANKISIEKKALSASTFIKARRRLLDTCHAALAHTRYVTKGHESVWANNHPVMLGSTFLTHNGHITNDDEVFRELGIQRSAEVDSQAVAAALDHHGLDNYQEATKMLSGSFAVAAVNTDDRNRVLLLKGPTSPLVTIETENIVVWASTQVAIQRAWKAITNQVPHKDMFTDYLISGVALSVTKDGIRRLDDFETKKYVSTKSWDGDFKAPACKTGWERQTPNGVVQTADFEKAVGLIRAANQGLAIRWEERVDADPEFWNEHNGKWHTCRHCKGVVAEIHMAFVLDYGDMCLDCRSMLSTQEKETAGVSNSPADYYKFSQNEWESLLDLADLDTFVHKRTISRMAASSGIPEQLIQYMLFHANVTSEKHTELYNDLDVLYSDVENEVWAEWSSEMAAEAPA